MKQATLQQGCRNLMRHSHEGCKDDDDDSESALLWSLCDVFFTALL